jgi:hypothetical protein
MFMADGSLIDKSVRSARRIGFMASEKKCGRMEAERWSIFVSEAKAILVTKLLRYFAKRPM